MPQPTHPRSRFHLARSVGLAVLAYGTAGAQPVDDFEGEFEKDVERLRAVNSGELQFLPATQQIEEELRTETEYIVRASSLNDGWVEMRQCQHGLDSIERAEILYAYSGLRALRITQQTAIDASWVEGQSVQLRGVGSGASICVAAEVNILRREAGAYRLCSGPYHRRFLDGYFPMQLSLRIVYPAEHLRLVSLEPAAQPGLRVDNGPGELRLQARFSGRLTLTFGFAALVQ